MKSIGVIGLGKMGEAIVNGSLERHSFVASMRSEERLQRLGGIWKEKSVRLTLKNQEVAKACSLLVLAVKPAQAEEVLRKLRPSLSRSHELVSICAGVTLKQLRQWAGPKPKIVRAMPNTPCFIGKGVTVLTPNSSPTVRQLFEKLGVTSILEEYSMDAVTGLSACGPAYAYLILEALSDAGVKVGLPRDVATLLAAQTLAGSAEMVLKLGRHPASLKDDVTTPAGCTIDGLMVLEDGKVRSALIHAVVAATKKSQELAR